MKRLAFSIVTALAITLSTALPIFAAGEAFYITDVVSIGCEDSQIQFDIMTENLNGVDIYDVNTVVTVGGYVYMNEQAKIQTNDSFGWTIYGDFSYGPVPNAAIFPLPVGEEVRIDFSLELPLGNVIYAWTVIFDSCETGNVLYNGETAALNGCRLNINGSVVGEAPNGAQIYYAPGHATNLSLNPGTYIVIGQDASETYYQVVLGCQTHWVRKDTMQPSYQAPQNGAPLPTRIVG